MCFIFTDLNRVNRPTTSSRPTLFPSPSLLLLLTILDSSQILHVTYPELKSNLYSHSVSDLSSKGAVSVRGVGVRRYKLIVSETQSHWDSEDPKSHWDSEVKGWLSEEVFRHHICEVTPYFDYSD